MNIAMYNSASAMSALERWQDTVSQNIAGSQINGFRGKTVTFSAEPEGAINADPKTRISDAANHALFPTVTTGVSFQYGDTQPTQRPLDVAIQGEGFFQVQAPDGSKLYTRDGSFELTSDRTLVTSTGAPVLSDGGSPITLSADQGPLTINHDGTLMQGTTTLGKLAVKKFSDNSALIPVKGGLFAAPAGVDGEQVDKPVVLQGCLESSNVKPVNEMMDMIVVSRAYEANQRIITTMDQEMQKALDALG